MSFGPELPPEEQARRMRIVNRLGLVLFVGLAALILIGGLIMPLLM